MTRDINTKFLVFLAMLLTIFAPVPPLLAIPTSANRACPDLDIFVTRSVMEKALARKPANGPFEVYLAYDIFDPDDAPQMVADPARQNIIYVDRQGNATFPNDGILYDLDDKTIIKSIRFSRETDEVITESGAKRQLKDIRFIRSYELFDYKPDAALTPRLAKISSRTVPAFNYAHGQVVGGKSQFQKSAGSIPMGELTYFRNRHLQNLTELYKKAGLPAQVWQDLLFQEASLADHRRFEIAIVRGPHLVAYVRYYDASISPVEQALFATAEPKIKMQIHGQDWLEFPTHLAPLERTLKDPSLSPIQPFRSNPLYAGHLMMEKGRLFIDKEHLTPDEQRQAQQMLMAAAKQFLTEIAPDGDLNKIQLFANGGPASSRVVQKGHGAKKIAEIQPSDLRSSYARLIRDGPILWNVSFTNPENLDFIHSFESSKPITILHNSAQNWFDNLEKNGLLAPIEDQGWNYMPVAEMFRVVDYLDGHPFN